MTSPSRMANDTPRRSRWWVWLILLGVAGAAAYLIVHQLMRVQAKAGGPAAQRPVLVDVARARTANMDLYLRELGTVTPLNTVTVRSRVDGQLVNVSYSEGQTVAKDQLLAQIDPRPFQAQLTVAQGQLARDQALLNNAQRDLKRYQDLSKQNYSVTQQQLDTQESLVHQYEGVVKTDQGQIDSINLQISYCRIVAPIAGRIGLRLVDQGNMVHSNDASGLAVITQVQPIAVVFTVPEEEISRVLSKSGPDVKLPVAAYDRDDRTKLASGELLAIDNEADPTTAMVKLKAIFPNTNTALFPNQFVRAWLLVDTLKGATVVPNAAVQRGPDNTTFVYIAKGDETVDLRNVRLGPSEGDLTAIESGITPGEMVVTAGVDKLQAGYKVIVAGRGGRGGRGAGSATRPAADDSTGAGRGARGGA